MLCLSIVYLIFFNQKYQIGHVYNIKYEQLYLITNYINGKKNMALCKSKK